MKSFFRKLKVKLIKSKFIMRVAWWYYVTWSNIVIIFEHTFLLESEEETPLQVFKNTKGESAIKQWEQFCAQKELSHWGSDPARYLFDAISSPQYFLQRKEGDCDDYALLARHYFGVSIRADTIFPKTSCTIPFTFEGIYLLTSTEKAHAVAVWKRVLENEKLEWFIVSNDNVVTVEPSSLKDMKSENKLMESVFPALIPIVRIGVLSVSEKQNSSNLSLRLSKVM